jgi:transcriptional regulator with XRE-family HTH domain
MRISGRQIAAARGLLGWSQQQLAVAADVTPQTINYWEHEQHVPRQATIERVRKAIEDRGVEFLNGGQPGVRMKAKPEAERSTSAD